MRIASGVTDQYIYFVAVDSSDHVTRKTGLSSFTVYRSRNNGTATAMTTPTVTEVSAANMPGVYSLLLDEDMTIDAGDETQEMVFHITATGMDPVTRTIELYRPKITEGETLAVASGIGDASVKNMAANALDAAAVASGALNGKGDWALASSLPTNFSDLAITATTGQVTVGTNNDKTGYSISGTKATLDALNDISAADVGAQVDASLDKAIPTTPTADSINERIKALDDLAQAGGAGDLAATKSAVESRLPAALVSGRIDAHVGSMGTGVVDGNALATSGVTEIRDAITGGAYALDTDANGRVRLVDGTGIGELSTSGGLIAGIAGTRQTFDDMEAFFDTATFVEPGQGAWPNAPTLVQMWQYVYKLMRNRKRTSASLLELFGDDGVTVDSKATISDDGTNAEQGEWISGP